MGVEKRGFGEDWEKIKTASIYVWNYYLILLGIILFPEWQFCTWHNNIAIKQLILKMETWYLKK